jgi:hypothetical protein
MGEQCRAGTIPERVKPYQPLLVKHVLLPARLMAEKLESVRS